MLWRSAMATARIRQRLRPAERPREDLVRRHASGRSFADIGCMWSVHGAIAFAAEEAGATAVTGLDLMPASAEYAAEHERRGSRVRFVQGDLHDEGALREVGPHDVVWCSGVLYHVPHPLLTLERLRAITRQTLILATETIAEAPGTPNACVFSPPPGTHPGHTEPLDPARGYHGWWWALTASAVRSMVQATGFTIVEEHGRALHRTLVAEPGPGRSG